MLIPPLFIAWSAPADELRIDQAGFDVRQTPQLTLTSDKHAVVAYRDGKGQLIARREDGEPIVLATAEDHTVAGLSLAAAEARVYAAWQEQVPSGPAAIRLRVSDDQAGHWRNAVTVDTATRPLPRIAIAGVAEDVYLAWLGSTPAAETDSSDAYEQTRYHIYARHSPDGGQTWHPTKQLTQGYRDSLWPKLVMHGTTAYAFSASRRNEQSYLIVTHSKPNGDWTQAEIIRPIGGALLLEPHVTEQGLLAIWFGTNGNRFTLEGAVATDNGHWQSFSFPGSEQFDIGAMQIASQGKNVYLVFSARSAVKPAGPWKRNVYFCRSSDGGKSWDRIRPLRRYAFDDTHAYFPSIAVGEDRLLTVVWNDFRNIRGDLYYNVSRDGGMHWLEKDRALLAPGKTNDFLFPFISALAVAGKSYFLLAGRYRDDGHTQAALILHRFRTDTETGYTAAATDEDTLRQRVAAFWQALVDAEYAKVYSLYDPFFRQRLREIDYLAMAGRVKHHSFHIGDILIQGNIAKVDIEFSYEIPPLSLRLGGSYSRPETQARIQETWLFIDGRWYKEYYNSIGEFSYARY